MRVKICIVLAAVGIMLAQGTACAAGDLAHWAAGKNPVKVYIQDAVNASGKDQVSAGEFTKVLAQSIRERRSVNFEVVGTPDASDARISAVITGYAYAEHDPIKPAPGGLMLLDAVTTENYCEMKADFTVTDTKTGKVIWQDSVEAYTKKMMTPAESLPIIYDKLSRKFLWKSFGKGK